MIDIGPSLPRKRGQELVRPVTGSVSGRDVESVSYRQVTTVSTDDDSRGHCAMSHAIVEI
jgi:hypothetical protein